jgi:hypothetical protein
LGCAVNAALFVSGDERGNVLEFHGVMQTSKTKLRLANIPKPSDQSRGRGGTKQ